MKESGCLMKEGDLIKFRYKDKIRYGYIIGMYDLLFIVKGFKPNKQYLLSRKEIINKNRRIRKMKYIIKCNNFYLAYIEVDSRFPESDFMEDIKFSVDESISFETKEAAEMVATKLFINLGINCIVEERDEYNDKTI